MARKDKCGPSCRTGARPVSRRHNEDSFFECEGANPGWAFFIWLVERGFARRRGRVKGGLESVLVQRMVFW